MTLIVNESGGINLTLEIGQGPPGPSTAATQAAQIAAELARDEAEISASEAKLSEISAEEDAASAFDSSTMAAASAEIAFNSATQTILNTRVFPTYSSAKQAVMDKQIADNSQVVVLRDETNGGRKVIYTASYVVTGLVVDFTLDVYATHEYLVFVAYILPDFFEEPPITSTSIGFEGAFAVDNDFLYVGVSDNLWKRVPLLSF